MLMNEKQLDHPSSMDGVYTRTPAGTYDIAPAFPLPSGKIAGGYGALAELIAAAVQRGARRIALDGYGGTLWHELMHRLEHALARLDCSVCCYDTASCYLPETILLERIGPSLGGNDPLFGRLYEGDLADFFDLDALRRLGLGNDATTPSIIYGAGAALAGNPDVVIYVDVPKDEIQRRIRAGTVTNLGAASPADSGSMYKRCYFVDWPVLNRHKAWLLPHITYFVDGSDPSYPTLIDGAELRAALSEMARTYCRPRPWFAPGPWGGQYMKTHFPGLDPSRPNYAWSFELVAPEQGLVFASGDERLECSFDLLMFHAHEAVLGSAAARFGYNFPIRFDYLDTIEGGNLSVQVHPHPDYIHAQFGEPFTQDESYYITTCKPGARVNLGFRTGVDPDEFRREVERSQHEGVTIGVERYIHSIEAHPHDLFLIPSGTIHGSGSGNLVLEISATPYIYTFKIYDWMRRDLNGKMRPLNIERAWQNLDFGCQEDVVRDRLCPQPHLIREGDGWREIYAGSHPNLFYAVHRYEFHAPVDAQTDGRCHLLNVVEGQAVILEAGGRRVQFNYGETFVVPAAAGSYRLIPLDEQHCKVVLAFVK